jgi:hypothetical protein
MPGELLDRVVEYRKLLLSALDGGQERRLLELDRALGAADDGEVRRAFCRAPVALSGALRLDAAEAAVEIVNLGVGGACLRGAPEIPIGGDAALRITASDGRRFECAAEIRWRAHQDGHTVLGLSFIGAPRQLP